jgi:hypothetical protein
MKTIKKQIHGLALLFGFLILFQSCVVAYTPTSMPLSQIARRQEKVRVEYNNSEIYRFEKIEEEGGNFYGIKETGGKILTIPIEVESINNLKIYDKSKSNWRSVAITAGLLGGFILIVATTIDIEVKPNINWGS